MQEQQYIQEDEIDLRELFKTLWDRKKFIIIFTSLVTILAIIYALMAPKVYEARAIFKIGEYKEMSKSGDAENQNINFSISTNMVDTTSELTKELEVLFIELLKNEKDREAKIDNISVIKGQKNIFEVVSLGSSNETAVNELKKILEHAQSKHQKVLDDVKSRRESKIDQLESKLMILKTKTLPTLKDKINRYNSNIQIYEQNFKEVQSNLKKIKAKNPTLATIQINEQKYLADMLITLRDSLEEYEAKKDQLEFIETAQIEEELNILKSLMESHNYKNTDIIGKVMTNDYPVKPKKKLIVVVAFVTGFILSIFLVFFMEFIRGFRQEQESDMKNDKENT
jgi:uncharacterized protein involved in exopolysaccharide biosynthesis